MGQASQSQHSGMSTETGGSPVGPKEGGEAGGSLLSVRNFPQSLRDLIGYKVRVIHPDDMVTMDFNLRRVNIHVGTDGTIGDITIG